MHLVNAFTKTFKEESMQVLNQVLQAFNQQYEQNRDQNWGQKVGLLNLILASQIQQYSLQFGANKITIGEQELLGYFQSLILPELDEQDVDKHPVVKAASMKFLFYFRAQISPQVALELLPKVSRQLSCSMMVNKIYAGGLIERLLLLKDQNKNYIFNSSNIGDDVLNGLLSALINALKECENIFILKALFFTLKLSGPRMNNFVKDLMPILCDFLK